MLITSVLYTLVFVLEILPPPMSPRTYTLCPYPTLFRSPRLGDHHLRTLTITGFPSVTFPGLLDELNRQAFAYRWSSRAIMLDKTDATKLLTKIRRDRKSTRLNSSH